jgi:hypothetical protein
VPQRRVDPLAHASWRTAGWVVIDSATVMLGDPRAFVAWRLSSEKMPDDEVIDGKIVFFATMSDQDCPVERGYVGEDPVAVRVELVNDVADVAGGWDVVGELVLDQSSCLVVDPGCWPTERDRELLAQLPAEDTDLRAATGVIVGSLLHMPAGRYSVEVFHSDDHDSLGVRLQRSVVSGGRRRRER